MGKHGKQHQDSNDFVLYFLTFAGDVVWQVVQPQEKDTKGQNEEHQRHSHDHQEYIRLSGCGSEPPW